MVQSALCSAFPGVLFERKEIVKLGLCRFHINVIHIVITVSNNSEHTSPRNTRSPLYLWLHSRKREEEKEVGGEGERVGSRKRGEKAEEGKKQRRGRNDKGRIMRKTHIQTRIPKT